MEPLDYIGCADLRACPHGSTWRRHTSDRAGLAVELSKCYAETGRLRRCSRGLWSAYRRLEDYSKCTRLIDTRTRRAYGKLLEATIYVRYVSPRRPSWSRHVELRVIASAPLDYQCEPGALDVDYWLHAALTLIHREDPELAAYIDSITSFGDADFKTGCREITGVDAGCGLWCNAATRYHLTGAGLHAEQVEIYDYRGYAWTVGGLRCA